MNEPWAAIGDCVFHPQGSWRSSLNHGDGEGVTVRGWWRGGDGEGIMSAPPAPCNLPRLSSLVIPNIGNAPGSTWLAKKGSEQTAAVQESIPCYAVDFWDSKHWGRNVRRAASSLNRDLFQAGVQEGCRAPAGRRRECGDASSRNTMLPSLDSNEFYCQRETRAQMWNLRESCLFNYTFQLRSWSRCTKLIQTSHCWPSCITWKSHCSHWCFYLIALLQGGSCPVLSLVLFTKHQFYSKALLWKGWELELSA